MTVLPKLETSLTPSMTGLVTLVIRSVAETPESLPPKGLLGSRWIVLGKTSGARRMAKSPRPKVVASKTSGSPVAWVAWPVDGLMLPSTSWMLVTSTCGK